MKTRTYTNIQHKRKYKSSRKAFRKVKGYLRKSADLYPIHAEDKKKSILHSLGKKQKAKLKSATTTMLFYKRSLLFYQRKYKQHRRIKNFLNIKTFKKPNALFQKKLGFVNQQLPVEFTKKFNFLIKLELNCNYLQHFFIIILKKINLQNFMNTMISFPLNFVFTKYNLFIFNIMRELFLQLQEDTVNNSFYDEIIDLKEFFSNAFIHNIWIDSILLNKIKIFFFDFNCKNLISFFFFLYKCNRLYRPFISYVHYTLLILEKTIWINPFYVDKLASDLRINKTYYKQKMKNSSQKLLFIKRDMYFFFNIPSIFYPLFVFYFFIYVVKIRNYNIRFEATSFIYFYLANIQNTNTLKINVNFIQIYLIFFVLFLTQLFYSIVIYLFYSIFILFPLIHLRIKKYALYCPYFIYILCWQQNYFSLFQKLGYEQKNNVLYLKRTNLQSLIAYFKEQNLDDQKILIKLRKHSKQMEKFEKKIKKTALKLYFGYRSQEKQKEEQARIYQLREELEEIKKQEKEIEKQKKEIEKQETKREEQKKEKEEQEKNQEIIRQKTEKFKNLLVFSEKFFNGISLITFIYFLNINYKNYKLKDIKLDYFNAMEDLQYLNDQRKRYFHTVKLERIKTILLPMTSESFILNVYKELEIIKKNLIIKLQADLHENLKGYSFQKNIENNIRNFIQQEEQRVIIDNWVFKDPIKEKFKKFKTQIEEWRRIDLKENIEYYPKYYKAKGSSNKRIIYKKRNYVQKLKKKVKHLSHIKKVRAYILPMYNKYSYKYNKYKFSDEENLPLYRQVGFIGKA